jgi:2-polyprenyl-3-methyl-5-hydroxy-6-metoxy-1,4-benzoquinol methylase
MVQSMKEQISSATQPSVNEAQGNEFAACPRCGSADGKVVLEGRDYLHGIKGSFYCWRCAGCGLCYQNPRPTAERLAQLYPSNYAPHLAHSSNSDVVSNDPKSDSQRPEAGESTSWLLRWGSRLIYSLSHRTGIGFTYPGGEELETYLCEQMGYKHSELSPKTETKLLGSKVLRACRRLAGIDLIPTFVPNGQLLEIGCATGSRLQSYRERGWSKLFGIELAEQAAYQAQQRGFSVLCEPVETATEKFPDEAFDVIVSSMVLEHLHNPFAVVQTIARKLKPGGEFLFSTVTLDGLDARWFGKYWGGYDFPRHMVYLRMSDIWKMVSHDFEQIECFHQNAPIDFLRSAQWREPEKRFGDRFIAELASAPFGQSVCEFLARMGQTCRVSVRCRKKT